MKSGEYNFTYNTLYGYPNQTQFVSFFSLFTFDNYMVRVLYNVTEVKNTRVGSLGGMITLKGMFHGIAGREVKCSIADISCKIVEALEDQIIIRIPPI